MFSKMIIKLKRHLIVIMCLGSACLVIFVYFLKLSETNNFYQQVRQFSENEASAQPVKKKVFLMWTTVFDQQSGTLEDCPLKNVCEMTYDKSRLHEADAVVFHASDVHKVQHFPSPVTPRQKFAFLSMETPENLKSQSVFEKFPKNYFHWTMTHVSSSTVHFPYGGYWVPPSIAKEKGFPIMDLSYDTNQLLREKVFKGIFWLVSNCITPNRREKAIDELSKYILIDIAGKCAKNETMKNYCPRGSNCHDIYKKYYFMFIAENTICNDYISEKYWDRFMLPVIPIVMRKRVYERKIPPKSYIAMDDFRSPKEMAEYLNYLMNNQTAYLEYFEWRNEGWTKAPWNTEGYRIGYCNLCDHLLQLKAEQPAPTIPDIGEWFAQESNCEKDDFVKQWTRS